MSVKFTNNSVQVKNALKEASIAFLEEAGGEIQSAAQRNSRVDTGETKGSFQHNVNEGKLECAIGSNHENAIWEEFGTGIYALKKNGRSKPWVYKDRNGEWHRTKGKKPNRALFNAFKSLRGQIESMAKAKFGGMN